MHEDACPVRRAGVEVHAVEDGCVVYVPNPAEVHFLNRAAMLALELCDGRTRWRDLQQAFEDRWGRVDFDVRATLLPQFEAARIIEPAPAVDASA
jgi:hypothetical protein